MINGRTANEISESIKGAIKQGAFRSGDALPAIRALAERLGVNRNTVASAYRHLSDAGVIEGRGRQGSRVAMPAGAAARGPMMLHDIGGGNPDGRLLPDVKAVLSQSAWLPRGYEDPPDNPALIDFARQQLADDGIPVGDVWIANGTFDAVEMILRAYLQPGDTIAVEDRTVSVAFWQVHGGDGGADHKLLGLDPRDVMPSKGAVIDAAYRAAARDTAYASRLVRGAAAVDEELIRGARDNLLEDYGAVTGYEASSSCDAWAGRSPLELVRGGVCGVRAADAAEAAFSSSIEAAARGALALKQVTSRVLGAASCDGE